jgi:hypothetical protein
VSLQNLSHPAQISETNEEHVPPSNDDLWTCAVYLVTL